MEIQDALVIELDTQIANAEDATRQAVAAAQQAAAQQAAPVDVARAVNDALSAGLVRTAQRVQAVRDVPEWRQEDANAIQGAIQFCTDIGACEHCGLPGHYKGQCWIGAQVYKNCENQAIRSANEKNLWQHFRKCE